MLIVHGRGQAIDSPPNVLRSYLAKWLTQFLEVQAFVSAQPADGGLGATWVLLRRANAPAPITANANRSGGGKEEVG